MDKLGSYLSNNPKIYGAIIGAVAITSASQVVHTLTKPKYNPAIRCYDSKGNVVDYIG